MSRRCPYCGELVPNNSLTCPKCYKKIPVEPEPVKDTGGAQPGRSARGYNKTLALILSVIPAFIGLLGLGLIYRDPRRKRGYVALVFGLVIFVGALFATLSLVLIFVAVPLWILYALMFLGCLAMVLVDNLSFRVG